MYYYSIILKRIFTNFKNLISREYCGPGYFGLFCGDICPYPHYGKYCDYTCTCGKQYCSHVNGCIPGKYNYAFIFFLF